MVWHSSDNTATLKYVRDKNTDEYGRFTLTLPVTRVTRGKPLLLKISGSDSRSLRWIGVAYDD